MKGFRMYAPIITFGMAGVCALFIATQPQVVHGGYEPMLQHALLNAVSDAHEIKGELRLDSGSGAMSDGLGTVFVIEGPMDLSAGSSQLELSLTMPYSNESHLVGELQQINYDWTLRIGDETDASVLVYESTEESLVVPDLPVLNVLEGIEVSTSRESSMKAGMFKQQMTVFEIPMAALLSPDQWSALSELIGTEIHHEVMLMLWVNAFGQLDGISFEGELDDMTAEGHIIFR